jgi:hypothetical protein
MRYQSARELLAELDFWEGRSGAREGLTSPNDISRLKTPLAARADEMKTPVSDLSAMKTPLIGHDDLSDLDLS